MTVSIDAVPAHRRRSRVSLAHPRRHASAHSAVTATNANPVHAVSSNLGTGNGTNVGDYHRRHQSTHGTSSMDSGHHRAGPPPMRTQSSTNLTRRSAHDIHYKRVLSASNLAPAAAAAIHCTRAPPTGSNSIYSIDSVKSADTAGDNDRSRVVGDARRSGSTLGTTPSDRHSFSSIVFGGNIITPLTVCPPSATIPVNSSASTSAPAPSMSTSSNSQSLNITSTVGALAPPSSPASPPMQVPSSVVLPKQPNPTPADGFFLNRTHSSYSRPHSPPMHAQPSLGGIASSSGSSSTASSSALMMMRQRSVGQPRHGSAKRPSALSGTNASRRTSDRKVRLDAPSSAENAAPVNRASSAKQLSTHMFENTQAANDAPTRLAPATAGGRKPSDQRVQAKWPAAVPSAARKVTPTAPVAPVAVPAVAAAKKSKFFIQSPSTDSDDEVFSRSLQLRADAAAAAGGGGGGEAKLCGQQHTSPLQQQDFAEQRIVIPAAHGQHLPSRPIPPAVKVAHVSQDGAQEYENAEDDDDDWSSETSSSSEADSGDIDRGLSSAAAQRANVAQTEAERQRLMFAKRTPSQVNVVKSNLSELLAQQRTAQTLQQDMQRAHAQHLMAKGGKPALGMHAGVGGLHGSKSAVTLPTVAASNRRPGQLRTTASGIGLTRLGGMPSGIELDSSDESDSGEVDISLPKTKPLNGSANVNGQSATSGSSPQSGSSSVDQQLSSARIAALMDRRRLSNSAQAVHPSPSPMSGVAPPVFTGDHIFTPTTTRRAMLADELTHSLRLNLVTERATRAGGMAGLFNRLSRGASQANITTAGPGTSPIQTRTQRGDAGFAHGQNGNGSAAVKHDSNFEYSHQQTKKSPRLPAFHDVADEGCEYRLPPRPSPPPRATSEPEVANYYSTGFHHVGW